MAALYAAAYGADRQLDAEEIRSWIRLESFAPEWLRVLEIGGVVVGYGDVDIREHEIAVDIAAPGHWDTFLDWAESLAFERGIAKVRVVFPAGHELEATVGRRGYRLWRSSLTMARSLDAGAAGVGVVAPEFRVVPYRDGDAEPLRGSLNEAFADDPFHQEITPEWFRDFYLGARGFDHSLWHLAWAGAELAGFALSFPERGGDTTLGWIHSLGVRDPWRRRGLGEVLLRTAFRALHNRGLRRVELGVDAENPTGAVRLYERVGMRPIRQTDNWVLDRVT